MVVVVVVAAVVVVGAVDVEWCLTPALFFIVVQNQQFDCFLWHPR